MTSTENQFAKQLAAIRQPIRRRVRKTVPNLAAGQLPDPVAPMTALEVDPSTGERSIESKVRMALAHGLSPRTVASAHDCPLSLVQAIAAQIQSENE